MVLYPTASELVKKTNTQARGQAIMGKNIDYKTKCPHCGVRVITYQLVKNGCYICGRIPKA